MVQLRITSAFVLIEAPMMKHLFRAVFIALILARFLCGPNGSAESMQNKEYLIKAAFLYNFTKFVDWPSESFKNDVDPIKLYILGDDPFGEALATIRDKMVKGRRLTITRVRRVEEIKGAHLLFISPSEKGRVKQILQSLRNTPVLTISEIEWFGQMGGIINFITVEDKVQFEINSEQAQQHQLKISSQLLKLARIVRSEP
jgi:hypothetical protein